MGGLWDVDHFFPFFRINLCKRMPSIKREQLDINIDHLPTKENLFSQITSASNLGYLAPPGRFFMGAKSFIRTP